MSEFALLLYPGQFIGTIQVFVRTSQNNCGQFQGVGVCENIFIVNIYKVVLKLKFLKGERFSKQNIF